MRKKGNKKAIFFKYIRKVAIIKVILYFYCGKDRFLLTRNAVKYYTICNSATECCLPTRGEVSTLLQLRSYIWQKEKEKDRFRY